MSAQGHMTGRLIQLKQSELTLLSTLSNLFSRVALLSVSYLPIDCLLPTQARYLSLDTIIIKVSTINKHNSQHQVQQRQEEGRLIDQGGSNK